MCGEGAEGSGGQLGGNAASSTVTAGQGAVDVCWRSCRGCLEAHEEERERQSRQAWRHGWQGTAAVVEAAEELHPSAAKLEETVG